MRPAILLIFLVMLGCSKASTDVVVRCTGMVSTDVGLGLIEVPYSGSYVFREGSGTMLIDNPHFQQKPRRELCFVDGSCSVAISEARISLKSDRELQELSGPTARRIDRIQVTLDRHTGVLVQQEHTDVTFRLEDGRLPRQVMNVRHDLQCQKADLPDLPSKI